MDISPRNSVILPLWLLAWATVIVVLMDIVVLRSDPLTVTVRHYNIESDSNTCALHLRVHHSEKYMYGYRSTDVDTCSELSKGQELLLNRTMLLNRWVSIENADGKNLTGQFLDSFVLRDYLFIGVCLILPIVLRRPTTGKERVKAYVVAAFIPIEIIHYWFKILI